MPRSRQGHPVIIQAGSSGRGKTFGAHWGEVIFVVSPHLESGQKDYAVVKATVARCGREPELVYVEEEEAEPTPAASPAPEQTDGDKRDDESTDPDVHRLVG